MPVGTASTEMMDLLIIQNWDISPLLGHPVIASACLATLQEITETDLMDRTLDKENCLNHFWYTL
jgi:4-aminobutyrate aminotransferase-like enzyme